jgi:hypothetical protein
MWTQNQVPWSVASAGLVGSRAMWVHIRPWASLVNAKSTVRLGSAAAAATRPGVIHAARPTKWTETARKPSTAVLMPG